MEVRVIGAGLAGSEAAYYLANKGYKVKLYEMRPKKMTPAHKTEKFGELVCSNSLKSDADDNACGCLKKEMKVLSSLMMESAELNKVPSGGALAVDREGFSDYITNKIKNNPNIEIIYDELKVIDETIPTIIATGPLTSDDLSIDIKNKFGDYDFYFFDAQAPIVLAETLDYNKVYLKSRYDKGEAAYLNCPMNKEEWDLFYKELITAECVEPHGFELKVFESCMPIEIMAKRGEQTLLFGPMKPVGLEKPDGTRPYAVVQLRQDDAAKTMYNLVGFQTHLKWGEQKRVFSLIPGLENATFVKYGVMHRNSYINAPMILKSNMQTKKYPNIFFAGQLSGVEGYVESAATGILAAIGMDRYLRGLSEYYLPKTTMLGCIVNYICTASPNNFQPMNANWGIMEDLGFKHHKQDRKMLYAKRALEDIIKAKEWLDEDR